MNLSPEDLQRAASDPRTPPAQLRDIAASHPELRPAIATNPSTYPELLKWLGEMNDPQVNAALAYRNSFPETGLGANGAHYGGYTAPTTAPTAASAGAAGVGGWSAHAGHELGGNPHAPWGGGPSAVAGSGMDVFDGIVREEADDDNRRHYGLWWFLLALLLALIGAFLVWKFVFDKPDSAASGPENPSTPPASSPLESASESTGGTEDPSSEDVSPSEEETSAEPEAGDKLASDLQTLGCPGPADAATPFITFTQQVAGDGPLSANDVDQVTAALTSFGNRCGGEAMWELADQLTHQASVPELANAIAASPAFGVRISASGGFVTPSENIVCYYYSEGPRPVECVIKSDANGEEHEYFLENDDDRKDGWNYRYLPPERAVPTQQYGWRDNWRGITCSLETSGVECRDEEGRSFHLSRADHGYGG